MRLFGGITPPNIKTFKTWMRILLTFVLTILVVSLSNSFGVKENSLEYCLEYHRQAMEGNSLTEDTMGQDNTATVPRSIILWSRWRMGSSFVGQLIASTSLKTFYSYESLHPYGPGILWDYDLRTRQAMKYLHHLLECRIVEHPKEVEYFSKSPLVARNMALTGLCRAGCCQHPQLVQEACLSSDIIVSKVVKLRLLYAREMLEKSKLDTTIVFLVRDPRAVMHSRSELWWCKVADCASTSRMCHVLRDDMEHLPHLQQQYPGRFILLRYEDLSINPKEVLTKLWKKLRLPLDEQFYGMLRQHTTTTDFFYNVFSTRRRTQEHLNQWRREISWDFVQEIQSHCSDVLMSLGLRVLDSEQQLRNLSFSTVII